MGLRGPQPKPGSQKWRTGGHVTLAHTLKPETKKVIAPADIRKDTKAHQYWKDHFDLLVKDGRLTHSNAAAFVVACKLYSDMHRLEEILREEPLTIGNGTRINPLVSCLRTMRRDFIDATKEFGLTPWAASRMPAAVKEDKDGEDEEALLRTFTA